jgi:hypothetical protein
MWSIDVQRTFRQKGQSLNGTLLGGAGGSAVWFQNTENLDETNPERIIRVGHSW